MTMTDVRTRYVGEPTKVEELCPDCFLPALWQVIVYDLTIDGIIVRATWRGCTDCGHRQREPRP